jgi:hypothetical protein
MLATRGGACYDEVGRDVFPKLMCAMATSLQDGVVDATVLKQIDTEGSQPVKLWLKLNKPKAKTATLRLQVLAGNLFVCRPVPFSREQMPLIRLA